MLLTNAMYRNMMKNTTLIGTKMELSGKDNSRRHVKNLGHRVVFLLTISTGNYLYQVLGSNLLNTLLNIRKIHNI